MTYEEFGTLIGVSKQRVSQLIAAGRLTLPLTREQADNYERPRYSAGRWYGPKIEDAAYAALDSQWRTSADITARIDYDPALIRQALYRLWRASKIERRKAGLSSANGRLCYEWRKFDA